MQWYGRIDIFVKIDNDTCIIIENKIYAYDQQYQLQRYIEDIRGRNFTNIYVVYLTLNGSPPSEHSISKNELEVLKEDNKFSAISYKGILEWLECVNVPKEHELLYSAFVQYKHSLNILCGGYAEKIYQIILNASKDELLEMLDKWDSLGEFQYNYVYKRLMRILYLHDSLEGKWEFASWNADEQKYEEILEKKYLCNLPHMYLYNMDKGVVLMIFKDCWEQIQLHYINNDLTDGGHPKPRKARQRYFNDWGGQYSTLIIDIEDIPQWIEDNKSS